MILNIVFGKNTIPIDTHVFRTSKRLGLDNQDNLIKMEKNLLKIIPTEYIKDSHFWLVDHGKKVCKARKPLCSECQISKFCNFFKKI